MEPITPQPTLSQELRALIYQRNILSTKSKSKVISDLDNQIIQDREKRKLHLRSKTIEEILTSELTYLNHLEIIIKFFKEPLQNSELISKKTISALFGNLESLYNVNGELLKQLKVNSENVGAAFLKLAPFFKLYSVYAYEYKHALSFLLNIQKTHPKLHEFIKKQETRPEVSCKLCSLLITPIQRIPRYRLLLRELLTRTASTHPHYPVLLDALAEVEKATLHINNLVQEQENMQRLVTIQRCFKGGKPVIVVPGRKLIKEGRLLKVSKNGNLSQERYFILLTDCVIYSKITKDIAGEKATEAKSLDCCCMLPIKKCSVELVLSHNVFKLSCIGVTLILYSQDTNVVEQWVDAIRTAKEKYQDGLMTLQKKSSSRIPLRRKELVQQQEQVKVKQARKRKIIEEETSDSSSGENPSPMKSMRLSNLQGKENQETSNGTGGSSLENKAGPSKKSNYLATIKSIFYRFGESVHQYWFPTTHSANVKICLTPNN